MLPEPRVPPGSCCCPPGNPGVPLPTQPHGHSHRRRAPPVCCTPAPLAHPPHVRPFGRCSVPFIWGKIPPARPGGSFLSSVLLLVSLRPYPPLRPRGPRRSPAGSAGWGSPPGSSWRWRGSSSARASCGRTSLPGGGVGAPGGASLPAPLLPRRPHSLEPTVRTARVTPPYFLIGSAGEPETGKSQTCSEGARQGGRGILATPSGPPGARCPRSRGGSPRGFAAPHPTAVRRGPGGAEPPRDRGRGGRVPLHGAGGTGASRGLRAPTRGTLLV